MVSKVYNEVEMDTDVNLIVNHINSTPRESLNGQTPYLACCLPMVRLSYPEISFF